MNSKKLTLFLWMIAFLLGGYIYFFEMESSSADLSAGEGSRVFPNLEAEAITGLEIKIADHHFLLERKAAEKWVVHNVNKSTKDRADSQVVGELIHALAQLKHTGSRSLGKGEKLTSLGLKSPRAVITIEMNHLRETILVGRSVPQVKKALILVQNQKRIYAVPQYIREIFPEKFYEYRKKNLVDITPYEVDYFFATISSQVFEFHRQQRNWTFSSYPLWKKFLKGPKSLEEKIYHGQPLYRLLQWREVLPPSTSIPFLSQVNRQALSAKTAVWEEANPASVRSFLQLLSKLKARRFLEPNMKNVRAFGLTPHRAVARIGLFQGQSLEKVILLWKYKDQGYFSYVRTESRHVILDLGPQAKSLLDRNINDFRSRRIFNWDREEIKKLSLRWKNKKLVFHRRKDGWKWEKSPSVDSRIMAHFLKRLLAVEKEAFPDWPLVYEVPSRQSRDWRKKVRRRPLHLHRAGLASPRLTIEVERTYDDQRQSLKLEVGKSLSPQYRYSRLDQGPTVFAISPAFLEPLWEQEERYFWNRQIIPNFEEVSKIVLYRGEEKIPLSRTRGEVYFSRGGKGGQWPSEEVEKFIQALSQMRIQRYFTPSEKYEKGKAKIGKVVVYRYSGAREFYSWGQRDTERISMWGEGRKAPFWVPETLADLFRASFKSMTSEKSKKKSK